MNVRTRNDSLNKPVDDSLNDIFDRYRNQAVY